MLAYGGFIEMPTPAPADLGGRPPNLARLAKRALRQRGPAWVDGLVHQADLGDPDAVRALVEIATSQQAPNTREPKT